MIVNKSETKNISKDYFCKEYVYQLFYEFYGKEITPNIEYIKPDEIPGAENGVYKIQYKKNGRIDYIQYSRVGVFKNTDSKLADNYFTLIKYYESVLPDINWNRDKKVREVKKDYDKRVAYINSGNFERFIANTPSKSNELYLDLRLKALFDYYLFKNGFYIETIDDNKFYFDLDRVLYRAKNIFYDYKKNVNEIQKLFISEIEGKSHDIENYIEKIKDDVELLPKRLQKVYKYYFLQHSDDLRDKFKKFRNKVEEQEQDKNILKSKKLKKIITYVYKQNEDNKAKAIRQIWDATKKFQQNKNLSETFMTEIRDIFNPSEIQRLITGYLNFSIIRSEKDYREMINKYPILVNYQKNNFINIAREFMNSD